MPKCAPHTKTQWLRWTPMADSRINDRL